MLAHPRSKLLIKNFLLKLVVIEIKISGCRSRNVSIISDKIVGFLEKANVGRGDINCHNYAVRFGTNSS